MNRQQPEDGWYNYKTGDYDYIPADVEFTDEQARLYISQDPSAQAMYDLLR